MSKSTRAAVAMIVLVLAPRVASENAAQPPRTPQGHTWTRMHTDVVAVIAAARISDAGLSHAQTTHAATTNAPLDLTGADLLRAELVLLREMDGMGETLDRALRNPAYMRDRRSVTALSAASRHFKQMASAFHAMTRDLSRVTGEVALRSDGRLVK